MSRRRRSNGHHEREIPEGMYLEEIDAETRAGKALELAQVVEDIDRQKEDQKVKAAAHRSVVKELEKRRATLAEDVRTGTELRDSQLEMTAMDRDAVRLTRASRRAIDAKLGETEA